MCVAFSKYGGLRWRGLMTPCGLRRYSSLAPRSSRPAGAATGGVEEAFDDAKRRAVDQLQRGDVAAALSTLDRLKEAMHAPPPSSPSSRPEPSAHEQHPRREAREGVDYLRGACFLQAGDALAARQALLEEMRLSPENDQAWDLLSRVEEDPGVQAFLKLPADIAAKEPHFALVYDGVVRHTMLHWPRLLSLWQRTRAVCKAGVEGNLIECGVAGGGGSIVMAVAARLGDSERSHKRPSSSGRTVFALDTFRGMPAPTASDVTVGDLTAADSTRWSTGTCAAPADHVLRLAAHFDVSVVPVVGPFGTVPLPPSATCFAAAHIDADWFESTKSALAVVWPRLQSGAFVQLDDYNYWKGCKDGADAYFSSLTEADLGAFPYHRTRRPAWRKVDGNAVYCHVT